MIFRPRLPLFAVLVSATLVCTHARAAAVPRPLVDSQAEAVVSAQASGAVSTVRGLAIELEGALADPGEAARAWLTQHAAEFGLEPGRDELRVGDVSSARGDTRVRLLQFHDGLRVEGADAMAVLDGAGRLRFVGSGFVVGLGSVSAPLVSPTRAKAAAFDLTRSGSLPSAELVISRLPAGDHPVWRVTSKLEDGRPVVTRIDALSGDVIEADAGVTHAVGNVWPTDPRAPLEERDLPGLLAGAGMRSTSLGIVDLLNPPVTPLVAGDYRLAPDDIWFDQVNTFWHAQHYFRDFWAPLGYPGPPDSLIVRIHSALDPQVATTTGSFVYLGLPIASYTHDASQSHDIVYHELTHAVIFGFGIQPGGPHREAGAMHEGLADYFAAAFTGDPVIGEWCYLRFPNGATRIDQPAPPWDFAHYDVVGFNGGPSASVWGNGMILSSGLWDLRNRIGAASDSLVLEALAYLPSQPLWSQFASAMLDADNRNHAGRYESDIVTALSRRLIKGAAVAGIEGPDALEPKEVGTFTASQCCGTAQGTYHWRTRPWVKDSPAGAWSDVGDGDTVRVAFEQMSQLSLVVASPWGDTLEATRVVPVSLPSLVLDGPTRVIAHQVGTWRAQINAIGPTSVRWQRQWRRPNSILETLAGIDDGQRTFAVDTSFDMTVRLVDGLGRAVVKSFTVLAIRDQPPPASRAPLVVRLRVDPAEHQIETGIELLKASDVKAVVYDVRGSPLTQVWNGPVSAGEHAIRWDDSALKPGIYFLRVQAGPHEHVVRFVIIR